MAQYVLGVDVGTTSTKTLLISAEDGSVLASHAKGYREIKPETEQKAEDWWDAVVETIRAVCSTPEIANNVKGISLSTQGGTVVPVDADFNPIDNAIVWTDHRCTEEREEFIAEFGLKTMYETSGWNLGTGLPALELRNMKKNKPELFNKAAMFLTVPDFVIAKMTGKPAVDLSNAGINQLTNIGTGDHDERLMAFAGVKREQLAVIVPSCEPVGTLTPAAAKELGLPESVVVSGGAHDQYAVALGAGIVETGDAIIGTGTAWVVTALRDDSNFASGLAQSISATKDKWGTMFSIGVGGKCLDWFREHVAGLEGQALDYGTINAMISERRAPGANGVTFYPYFNGMSLPEKDGNVKATVVGLTLAHDRCDIAQAVMEGVTYQIACALDLLKASQKVDRVIVAGGATKSPVWMQMLANVIGHPIYATDVADLACVGAGMMAAVGCGIYGSTVEAAAKMTPSVREIKPNEDAEAYAKLFDAYKKGAKVLSELYAVRKA